MCPGRYIIASEKQSASHTRRERKQAELLPSTTTRYAKFKELLASKPDKFRGGLSSLICKHQLSEFLSHYQVWKSSGADQKTLLLA